MRIFRHLSTFLFSSLLHLLVAAPLLLSIESEPPPVVISGDGGSADTPSGLGAVPASTPISTVSVSLYVPSAAPPEAASAEPAASAPKRTSAGRSASGPRAHGGRATRSGDGITRVGGGGLAREGDGKPVQRTRGRRNNCELSDEIEKIGELEWALSREMVDYYASHLNEAGKHANVAVHKGPDGKRNGALLYLSRCSLLKQGGLRNGDVIHTINGRKVQSVPQALSTYLSVRKETWVTITLTRRGEQRVHRYKLR